MIKHLKLLNRFKNNRKFYLNRICLALQLFQDTDFDQIVDLGCGACLMFPILKTKYSFSSYCGVDRIDYRDTHIAEEESYQFVTADILEYAIRPQTTHVLLGVINLLDHDDFSKLHEQLQKSNITIFSQSIPNNLQNQMFVFLNSYLYNRSYHLHSLVHDSDWTSTHKKTMLFYTKFPLFSKLFFISNTQHFYHTDVLVRLVK